MVDVVHLSDADLSNIPLAIQNNDPAQPASGVLLYAKSDGLYTINSGGVVGLVGGGGDGLSIIYDSGTWQYASSNSVITWTHNIGHLNYFPFVKIGITTPPTTVWDLNYSNSAIRHEIEQNANQVIVRYPAGIVWQGGYTTYIRLFCLG